jgi:hypothetical protein
MQILSCKNSVFWVQNCTELCLVIIWIYFYWLNFQNLSLFLHPSHDVDSIFMRMASPLSSIVMSYSLPQWLYVPDLLITVSSDAIEVKTVGLCWCLASYVNVQSCQLNGLNHFLNVVGLRNQNQYLSWEESLISYVCNFCKCPFVNCIFLFR